MDSASEGITDYKEAFEKEKLRLAKLWEAYEVQQRDIEGINAKVLGLEKEVDEKERIVKSLKEVLEMRDKEIRELDIERSKLRHRNAELEPRIESLESDMRSELERFSKLFALAEDLEADLNKAKAEIVRRDVWFKENMGVFKGVSGAIEDWEVQIHKTDIIPSDRKGDMEKI
jgi:chromosome segregation ATPase